MTAHWHHWVAMALACGRYRCICGATGWRDLRTGLVREHKERRRHSPDVTAQPRLEGGWWVPAMPGSDEQGAGR